MHSNRDICLEAAIDDEGFLNGKVHGVYVVAEKISNKD
jgi:hypothetical protein